jgi:hypothetical protein
MRGRHRVSKYIESQFTRKIYWSNSIIMRVSHSGIIEIRKRREDSEPHLPILLPSDVCCDGHLANNRSSKETRGRE